MPKFNFPNLEIPNFEHLKLNIPEFNVPKFAFIDAKLLESLRNIGKAAQNLKNNPELQFAFITDLEILNLKSAEEFNESLVMDLTDEDIHEKEGILSENLIPFLKELGLVNLWYGANHALENKENPDN